MKFVDDDDTDLFKKAEIYSLPNFDEIYQFTAEIRILPVSENGRPPYWNFGTGFDFDECRVIGMSFYICLPNFVIIGRASAKL